MTEPEYIWVVSLGEGGIAAPWINQYELVRRYPKGGCVVRHYDGELRLRPSPELRFCDTRDEAITVATEAVLAVRAAIQALQWRLNNATLVIPVPADGTATPFARPAWTTLTKEVR